MADYGYSDQTSKEKVWKSSGLAIYQSALGQTGTMYTQKTACKDIRDILYNVQCTCVSHTCIHVGVARLEVVLITLK